MGGSRFLQLFCGFYQAKNPPSEPPLMALSCYSPLSVAIFFPSVFRGFVIFQNFLSRWFLEKWATGFGKQASHCRTSGELPGWHCHFLGDLPRPWDPTNHITQSLCGRETRKAISISIISIFISSNWVSILTTSQHGTTTQQGLLGSMNNAWEWTTLRGYSVEAWPRPAPLSEPYSRAGP